MLGRRLKMILIRRNKLFSVPKPGETVDPETAKNPMDPQAAMEQEQANAMTRQQNNDKIALEQMKNQRQAIQVQNSRQIMRSKMEMQKSRQLVQLQRMQKDKDDTEMKNQIRIAKNSQGDVNPAVRNASLYKSRSKIIPTVGMPG